MNNFKQVLKLESKFFVWAIFERNSKQSRNK